MHIDRANRSTDLLDMAFASPNPAKHDIRFRIGDNLGSDHLSTETLIDASPHRNSSTNHTKHKFDQTDREVFESTLEAVLGSDDLSADPRPLVTSISTLTALYPQLALQSIKPFQNPKACDLRVTPFLKEH